MHIYNIFGRTFSTQEPSPAHPPRPEVWQGERGLCTWPIPSFVIWQPSRRSFAQSLVVRGSFRNHYPPPPTMLIARGAMARSHCASKSALGLRSEYLGWRAVLRLYARRSRYISSTPPPIPSPAACRPLSRHERGRRRRRGRRG